jgi:hypothetical protein
MGKKKAKEKKQAVPKKPAEVIERPVLDSLDDIQERPEVVEAPVVKQPIVIHNPQRCGCGGTLNVKSCSKCGRTWCDLCLRSNKTCPICNSRGE